MITGSKVGVWNRALSRVGVTTLVESEEDRTPAAEQCGLAYDDIVKEVLEAYIWPWALRHISINQLDSQSQTTAGDASNQDFTIPFSFHDPASLTVVWIDNAGVETELVSGTDYTLTPPVPGSVGYITTTATPAADESIKITVTTTRFGWDHVYVVPPDFVTPVALLREDMRHRLTPHDSRAPFDVMVNEAGDGFLLCCDLDDDDFDGLEYVALVEEVSIWPRTFLNAVVLRLAAELAAALEKNPQLAAAWMGEYYAAVDHAAAHAQNVGHELDPTTPSLAERA